MPDIFTKKKRSEVMARIRSRGNRDTELVLVALFRRQKITGWRRHIEIRSRDRSPEAWRGGAGFRVRPDFVFKAERLAVFVDGCFWHGCPRHGTRPKNNAAFWRKKIAGNQSRDRLVTRSLRRAGWRVLRIWEHELTRKAEARLGQKLRRFWS